MTNLSDLISDPFVRAAFFRCERDGGGLSVPSDAPRPPVLRGGAEESPCADKRELEAVR